MTRHIKTILAASTALGLAACGDANFGASLGTEAGSFIDEGNFGDSTRNNELVLRGELQYTEAFNNRFENEVETTVNFAFDSANLGPEARAILDEQAAFINAFPEVAFRVYGHTDLVGPEGYNKALGLARARAVVNYLSSRGVDRSRLQALVSFGETEPLVPTEERERRNRRAVTDVSGFVASHPMVLHGKYAQVIFREYVGSAGRNQAGAGGGISAVSDGG